MVQGWDFMKEKVSRKKARHHAIEKVLGINGIVQGWNFMKEKVSRKKKKTRNHAIEKVLRKKRSNYANDHAIGPEEKASFVPTFCFLNLIDSVVSCILS